MTPLPPPHGPGGIVFWRIDQARFAGAWDSGEGAFLAGGRWSPVGVRAVYCALDPATAILEVAVHRGFPVLDTQPHVLSWARMTDGADMIVVTPEMVPNPNWLRPGVVSAGQQAFGARLLATHLFVAVPSTVSAHSWNLVFDAARAGASYGAVKQERFGLDTRLHPVGAGPAI